MNDTDSDDLEKLKNEIKALETRRYSKHYDPRDKLRTSHIKMTPVVNQRNGTLFEPNTLV